VKHSRQIRIAVAASAALALIAGALFASGPARAETAVDPRLALAQANVQAYCTDLVDDATTTRQRNTRADLCTMWTRQLADLSAAPSPTVTPTQPQVTPSPSSSAVTTPTSTPTPTAPADWPTAATTGTPAGWVPVRTVESLTVSLPGAIVEDVRVLGGDIVVTAPGVTIRRVELVGGAIVADDSGGCRGQGLTVEDSTFLPPAGQAYGGSAEGAIRWGGYTARRVKVVDRVEGLRVASQPLGCGPVTVEDSYISIAAPLSPCYHADGIQGYTGAGLTVRNTVIDARGMECGTSAIFYGAGDGNTGPVVLDRVWVAGGGWTVVLGPAGSRVTGLEVLDGSWQNGPYDVDCGAVDFSARVVDASGATVNTRTC
jgi:hypothetical protein